MEPQILSSLPSVTFHEKASQVSALADTALMTTSLVNASIRTLFEGPPETRCRLRSVEGAATSVTNSFFATGMWPVHYTERSHRTKPQGLVSGCT